MRFPRFNCLIPCIQLFCYVLIKIVIIISHFSQLSLFLPFQSYRIFFFFFEDFYKIQFYSITQSRRLDIDLILIVISFQNFFLYCISSSDYMFISSPSPLLIVHQIIQPGNNLSSLSGRHSFFVFFSSCNEEGQIGQQKTARSESKQLRKR